MINPFGQKPQVNPSKVSQIKTWVRETFSLSDEQSVMVTEMRCIEEDCPPLETVIAILSPNQPAKQKKIFKAISDVEIVDIENLVSNNHNKENCSH